MQITQMNSTFNVEFDLAIVPIEPPAEPQVEVISFVVPFNSPSLNLSQGVRL